VPGSPGGAPAAGGAAGLAPPAPAADPFTRLTRAEYLATVAAALGVEADATLIPVDGRVGPFTSNAAASTDPVHPYLILAEDLAALAVPRSLPACESASAMECVRDEYGPALERLYRRPLADAERASLAALVVDLVEQGASSEDATRAMLSSALIAPDFLFRSAVESVGKSARGRRLAERLSYALWDTPPDEALISAAEAEPQELEERLVGQALRLVRDARAVPVLARFIGQWLHVDVDLKLEDPTFEASPRFQELLRFTAAALAGDVAVTELIAGNRGYVHRDNLELYGLDDFAAPGSDSIMQVTWADTSPRRGVLSQELFADATRHPDKSRRVIFRGRMVRTSLLCDTIPLPAPDLVAAAAEVSDRTVEPRCAGCHLMMDPIGKAFAVLDPDDSGGGGPAEIRSHLELEGSYPDLPSLLAAVATSRAYAECFARNWLGFFLEVPLAEADAAWVAQIADAVQGGATLGDIVERTLATLESGSRGTAPLCPSP
jgi:hypothetical protein